jgi:uncharacterized membrane protein
VTWLRRHRARHLLGSSLWITPVICMAGALVAAPVVRRLDELTRWTVFGFGAEGARTLMAALVTTAFTCIVFVFTIVLVAVQIASAQLTPRIIARAFENRATRACLGLFAFTLVYGLAVMSRIDAMVPQASLALAIVLNMATLGTFLYLVNYMGHHLRPVTVLTDVGSQGAAVIDRVYPKSLSADAEAEVDAAVVAGSPASIVLAVRSGVVLAFDIVSLLALAERENGMIEVVPQVGDFVARGDPLFRVHGTASRLDARTRDAIALGPERTMEQDPAFALRIVVDIALKALSPAVNDPTTAVLAIDQVHHLLRSIGLRQLDTGIVRDRQGRIRLLYRTPDWEDFVELAVTEIRLYGAGSVQVVRRLCGMLENLLASLPPSRVARLRTELALLHQAIALQFRNVEDRLRASRPDPQGMGGFIRARRLKASVAISERTARDTTKVQ